MIAAIANAVANAVGEHAKNLPVTLPMEIENVAEDEGE
jgi:CO/xanthine dehydrogenase Mo-binding subunit